MSPTDAACGNPGCIFLAAAALAMAALMLTDPRLAPPDVFWRPVGRLCERRNLHHVAITLGRVFVSFAWPCDRLAIGLAMGLMKRRPVL